MFFETLWQGLIFVLITTVGMLAVAYALMGMWTKKYGDTIKKGAACGHDAHSDH